jgi:hypothetical protein
MNRRNLIGALGAAAVLAAVPAGLAGTPSGTQYNNALLGEAPPATFAGGGDVAGVSDPGLLDSATGALPFTGFEASLIVLAGLGLVGLGFGLRRLARRDS